MGLMTPKEMRFYFIYCPASGRLMWRANRGGLEAGSIAGGPTKDGYRAVMFGYRNYPVHRIAWTIMTGTWPEHEVVHRNRERSDNRWTNLTAGRQRKSFGESAEKGMLQ